MNRKSCALRKKKGAVCAGLFLGILFMLAGCVKPAVGPGITSTSEPTATAGAKPTPVPEIPTGTPEPTVTEPAVKPTVAPTIEPTKEPEVTTTGVVTPTNSPETTPNPTATPAPSEGDITPEPSLTPDVPGEAAPEPTETPVPLPTAMPEYDTLLQNGWQRTEDFFGCREIFFSGRFDDAEPVVGQGSYEFSYRSFSDVSVLLRIIGEEGIGVQSFVDELRQNRPECLIVQEGPGDYSYVYADGRTQVNGRIYECRVGDTENRMRVEFYSPAGADMQTEGYGFYLR